MADYNARSLKMHEKYQGKLEVRSKVPLSTRDDMSIAYTPGVAEPCRVIAKDKSAVYKYTSKGNFIAVVTDGSALLGLGNIGPEASLPVMEGKCILFKEFGNVDAIPICIDSQDPDDIVNTVKLISPSFGGINLEDISSPRCFEIERRLIEEMDIPIFHDDQHGTAVVTLAGLINALKIVGKKKEEVKVVVSGVGAAGVATTKLLLKYGYKHFNLVDSKGIVYAGRPEGMNAIKEEMAVLVGAKKGGNLADAMRGADVFVGVSRPDIVTPDMVKSMNEDSIIFDMANPDKEILPDVAKWAGAAVVATGRSDYPNQVNNVLAFPGIMRGVLDARVQNISDDMKIAAAEAIAAYVPNPSSEEIIPSALDKGVAKVVAEAVKAAC